MKKTLTLSIALVILLTGCASSNKNVQVDYNLPKKQETKKVWR